MSALARGSRLRRRIYLEALKPRKSTTGGLSDPNEVDVKRPNVYPVAL